MTLSVDYSVRRVFKGASIYGLGEVLVKGAAFLLLPVYTHYLSPEEFGIIGYLTVFLSMLTVIVAFGAHGAQTRYYYENHADPKLMGRFAFTINLVPVAFAFIVGLPLVLMGTTQQWTIGSAEIPFMPYMVLTLWAVIMQVIANNATAWYRARQQFTIAALLQFFRFFCIAILSLVLIIGFSQGALGYIAGIALGVTVFVAITLVAYTRHFVWHPSKDAFLYSLAFGAPIVVHLLANQIHNIIDRLILERYVSLDDLGIYTLGFMVGNAFNMLLVGFNQAYQPSYFQLMSSERADKNGDIVKTFKAWLLLVTILAITGIVFGGIILRVIAGDDFSAVVDILPWIILAMYLGGFYYFFSGPIFFFKMTRWLPVITGASAFANIALNFWWIPIWGIQGAAAATVVSHAMHSTFAYSVGSRLQCIKWPWGYICIAVSAVLIVFLMGL